MMNKLDQNKVNNIVSQKILSKQELKDVVNYYLNEQKKKYHSIKSLDYEAEQNKEQALINSRTWGFIQEILKGDDIDVFSSNYQKNLISNPNHEMKPERKEEMEIELSYNSHLDNNNKSLLSVDENRKQQSYQECYETKEKALFYYEFYQAWYNKSEQQRMQIGGYDHKKMPNFLFKNESQQSMISLEQSKGMIACKSYSDLEIIQDLLYYDNHLQRFAKLIKWLQNECLESQAFDPQAINVRNNQNEVIQIENWAQTQIENERLNTVYQLLKQNQNESAYRYLTEQQMILPQGLLDSVFPYHDYLLGDSNNPSQVDLSPYSLKNQFLVDIFQNIHYHQTLKARLEYYKNNSFKTDNLFSQQIGNPDWLYSLRSAYLSSEEKRTTGETLYFSYLCSNKSKLQSLAQNDSWYENLWITLKNLYLHEVLKRFLVIKGLLYESIEQYYPNYENNFIDFSHSPYDNYRKIFDGVCLDKNIYEELSQYLNEQKSDKYELQTQLILAYLSNLQQQQYYIYDQIYSLLNNSSAKASKESMVISNSVCEFNAKIAFTLFHSQFVTKHSLQSDYDQILQYFILNLIIQDRQQEIIAFLKNLHDENIIFGLMARYMSQKQSDIERKKIKQDLMLFGYSDSTIQGILKELVNNQFSSFNNQISQSISDSSIIDGLKMLIESYQNNLYTCMTQFLSASRQFLQEEKLQYYQQMREDREIKSMIERYQQLINPQSLSLDIIRDQDPFINQLIAYDDLLSCSKLFDNLQNIQSSSNQFRLSDQQNRFIKNTNQSMSSMIPENQNISNSKIEKCSQLIEYCEKTFFKYNNRSRKSYILIDQGVIFSQPELQEYNSHGIAERIFRDLSAQYLKLYIIKCIDIAITYKSHDKMISFINKYFSPQYDAFTLFTHDDQESILKKTTALLTQNTQFMRTVLNL